MTWPQQRCEIRERVVYRNVEQIGEAVWSDLTCRWVGIIRYKGKPIAVECVRDMAHAPSPSKTWTEVTA